MTPEAKWLMDYLDEREILQEMHDTINEILFWNCQEYYESKNARIAEWDPDIFDAYEIACQLFIGTLLHPQGMTYQAMIGYLSGLVRCADPLDRAKCAAEVIAIAFQQDLVTLTRLSDQTLLVSTEFVLPVEIPEFARHLPCFNRPTAIDFVPILGCRFKQHEKDICLDHIERMNSIALSLDERIIDAMEEYQKSEPETTEQEEQWQEFKRRSAETYQTVLENGNRFYLRHNYDTRGRCYCEGYYINYQGSQYKKAIVQLADKEVVKI